MHQKILNLFDSMSLHAQVEYPKECCGIITKDFIYIPCRNLSQNPKSSFILDPAMLAIHENSIWGFYHSHPNGRDPIPSRHDIIDSVFEEFKFVVGFAGTFYIYWLNNDKLEFERLNESHFNI